MTDRSRRTRRRPALPLTLVLACLAAGLSLAAQPRPWFDEVTAATGLTFVHDNGATGEFHLPEIMGAGVALADIDNDGDLDVILVQSGKVGTRDEGGQEDSGALLHQVWRNDLRVAPDGTRTLTFTDVSARAGLVVRGYGMGIATGDYDGDGLVDLYITGIGSNTLWRNRGDGTFEDVTDRAGVDDPRWSTSASFADLDGDGRLDLFVTNYVDFTWTSNKPCTEPAGSRDYCSPKAYRPVPDRLFRNRGDGTFEDVSEAAGILRAYGNGLGVAVRDFDLDGRLDVYVANDATPSQLWRNQGDGTFEDEGLLSGVAFNAAGRPEGSMGVAAGDPDADGDEDILVSNLVGETFVFYRNDGTGGFEDHRAHIGLAQPTATMTGFGTEWLDADNDGVSDLILVNGAVNLIPALRGTPNPFRQRNQLMRGVATPDFRLEEISGDAAGPAFAHLEVSRGLAIGDLDNDGYPDAVISNNAGPARVLRNTAATGNHWIGLELRQPAPNRFAIGATVTLTPGPSSGRLYRVHTDGSYLSASDPRILVGLGGHDGPVTATVTWPDGTTARYDGLTPGRYHRIERPAAGSGVLSSPP